MTTERMLRLRSSLTVVLAVQLAAVCLSPSPASAAISPAWQPWTAHETQCSTTCGQGIRCRRRDCIDQNSPERDAINLDLCAGGEKASRDCLPCRAYVICPQNGAWGDWGEWSECMFNATEAAEKAAKADAAESAAADSVGGDDDVAKVLKAKTDMESAADQEIDSQHGGMAMPARGNAIEFEEACGKGTRTRKRDCDNPPPGPNGLRCGGGELGRLHKEECEVPCSDDIDFLDLVKKMLAKDLAETPNQLVYVNYGATATLDCKNDAYSLALSSVKSFQHLQINWRKNNDSVTAIQTKTEWLIQKKQQAKGLDQEKKSIARESKLEMATVRGFDTKLMVDPVDADHVGLYACYMILEGEYYLMRTFTLLTRQLPVKERLELQTVEMPTNTETFMDAQLPSLESAVIRWYHNGLKKREQLLADWYERSWSMVLTHAETGAWECYLMVDEKRQWKTNEFKLTITAQLFFMQKFSDAYQAYFVAACALILYAVVGFPLAVVTLRQREENWITAEEQRCIEHVRQLNYLYMARYVRRIS